MKIFQIAAVANTVILGLCGQTDWPAYGHDPGGQRYSPLTQINTTNVSKLKPAWQYGIDPSKIDLNSATRALTATEAVPIMPMDSCTRLLFSTALWRWTRRPARKFGNTTWAAPWARRSVA